ncbi:magnesium transporter MgtE N-terminal domain-containing protein, partial [Chloroflexota bacterium]
MKPRVSWFIYVALALFLILASSPAYAQDEAIPPLPHAFYGNLTFTGGVNAPAGTKVIAKVGGIACGEITTTTAGKYGGADPLAPKLVVYSVAGAKIEFYVTRGVDQKLAYWEVDGETVSKYTLVPAETTELHLTSAAPTAPVVGGAGAAEEPTAEEVAEELEGLSPDEAAEVLEEMSSEDVADVMEVMDSETAADVIEVMDSETAADVMDEMDSE